MTGWLLCALLIGAVALAWPWLNQLLNVTDEESGTPDAPFDDWADQMHGWPVLDEEPEVRA